MERPAAIVSMTSTSPITHPSTSISKILHIDSRIFKLFIINLPMKIRKTTVVVVIYFIFWIFTDSKAFTLLQPQSAELEADLSWHSLLYFKIFITRLFSFNFRPFRWYNQYIHSNLFPINLNRDSIYCFLNAKLVQEVIVVQTEWKTRKWITLAIGTSTGSLDILSPKRVRTFARLG